MKPTVFAGWTFALLAIVSMFIGHMGAHELSWIGNHISTFAANAPHDDWITASMLLSALALLCISVLITRYHIVGSHYLIHLVPALTGAAVSGLILLAFFEETAPSIVKLRDLNFHAIREQTFHDAGLLVFFYGAIALTLVLGYFCMFSGKSLFEKVSGIIIASLGPISFLFMTTSWLKIIGFSGPGAGLKQRISLLCIWTAMVLFLILATRTSLKRVGR